MVTPKHLEAEVEPRSLLRQGKVLLRSDAARLNPELPEDKLLIVASHDCDCVQPSIHEPHIELMQAGLIDTADGNYTNAKNPRMLHLAARQRGTEVTLEIKAAPKFSVEKTATLGMAPDSSIEIGERGRHTLSIWLRSRYSRTALPDALVERLQEVKSTVEDAVRPHPKAFHGVYISFDPHSELTENETYELDIALVYDETISGAKIAAETAAEKIKRKFEKKFMQLGAPNELITWKGIFLSSCEAISDTEFRFAEMLTVQQLSFDHFSLRQDPQVPVPEI